MTKVTVVDFDGNSTTGIITGGDGAGVWVQPPANMPITQTGAAPIRFEFANVRAIIVHQ